MECAGSVGQVSEKDLLVRRLAGQRRHVLDQIEGLSDDQLRVAVLPSGWSILGLLRHLTLSDERYWFEVIVAGGPLDFWPEDETSEWQVGPDEPAQLVIDNYQAAIANSEAIVTARSLDDPPATTEDWWASAGMSFPDLRSVIVHVLVETANHAGHLDAVREILDGKQYIVL